MNRPSIFGLLIFILAALFAPHGQAAQQLWTCGMHPQIIKTEPGDCPICGMKLVPVRANTNGHATAPVGERRIKYYKSSMNPGEVSPSPGKDSMGMELVPVYEDAAANVGTIQIDPVTVQRMNLKTGLVTRGPVLREFRTVGTVAYDEAGLRDVTLKYDGWIEKLFVNTTWAKVKVGDPLFEIYSPDLYNAELNYLVARGSEGDANGPLSHAALGRLQLFDVPKAFIDELTESGKARRTFVYRAPSDGVVIEKMALAGQMVKAGERIFRLADLSHVWVLAQIYEQDLPFVRAGQDAAVRVTYGPERTIDGRVDLMLPQVEELTRTATARIVLPNSDGSLRPGMFVDIRFAAKIVDDAVLVPDLAVLRSGEHDTVFLANADGSFEPRDVRLGVRSQGNSYQVLEGLAGGERVVTSGQFMLDSESQLRDAIQKMVGSSEKGVVATAGEAQPGSKTEAPEQPRRPSAESAAVGMDDMSMLPADARALLQKIAFATITAGDALAVDDLAGYQKQLPVVRQSLADFFSGYPPGENGSLGRFRDALPDRPDLKAARLDFAVFSTVLTDLVRQNHIQREANLHAFQCPMAPGIGTGRWLQRTAVLKNPFYGSAMLECGDGLK